MAKPTGPATVDSLLEKGDGVLVRRENVWTYPNCPNDRSGTNLIMPSEFVSDAAVQEVLAKGDLVTTTTGLTGATMAVMRKPEGDAPPIRLLNMAHAGSVEAATELPLNSRPTHDAGKSDAPAVYVPPAGTGAAPKPAAPAASPVVLPAAAVAAAPKP